MSWRGKVGFREGFLGAVAAIALIAITLAVYSQRSQADDSVGEPSPTTEPRTPAVGATASATGVAPTATSEPMMTATPLSTATPLVEGTSPTPSLRNVDPMPPVSPLATACAGPCASYLLLAVAGNLPTPSDERITTISSIVLNTEFIVQLSIEHSGPADTNGDGLNDLGDCLEPWGEVKDPLPFGCYQGAQWHLDYDPAIVDIVGLPHETAIRASGAPLECSQRNDDGERVLLGCLSIDPQAPLTYAGATWNVRVMCIRAGVTTFTLHGDPTSMPSFVANRYENPPSHLRGVESFVCGAG